MKPAWGHLFLPVQEDNRVHPSSFPGVTLALASKITDIFFSLMAFELSQLSAAKCNVSCRVSFSLELVSQLWLSTQRMFPLSRKRSSSADERIFWPEFSSSSGWFCFWTSRCWLLISQNSRSLTLPCWTVKMPSLQHYLNSCHGAHYSFDCYWVINHSLAFLPCRVCT